MLYMHLLLLYNQSVNHTLNVAHKQQTAILQGLLLVEFVVYNSSAVTLDSFRL